MASSQSKFTIAGFDVSQILMVVVIAALVVFGMDYLEDRNGGDDEVVAPLVLDEAAI